MITKSRAEELKQAWLKYRGYSAESHPEELKSFLQGMRAMAGEWVRAEKIRDPHHTDHLKHYNPPGDEMDNYPFFEYYQEPSKGKK